MAFNILLAGVPFILLLAGGLGFVLGGSPDVLTGYLSAAMEQVMPLEGNVRDTILSSMLADIERTRVAFGIGGALGFLFFSARLFGSLRSVMRVVFEHGRDRTFLGGWLWDVQLTAISAVLLVAWVMITTWLTVTTGQIGRALASSGLFPDVLSGFEYWVGRSFAFVVLVAIFFALYRWLPRQRTPWMPALVGAGTASLLLEAARWVFALVTRTFPPSSIYTGSIAALVLVVFWTYYVALIFVLGAETAATTKEHTAPDLGAWAAP